MAAIDTVPGQSAQTAQANTSSSGMQILNQLLDLHTQQTKEIEPFVKAALTPVPASAQTSPELAVRPARQFTPAPLIDKETVGAHATKSKGIANTIIGLTNIVGKYKAKSDQDQQRALAVDIERVMQAQDGITQAKQMLVNNPNDANAKGMIQKNSKIIDAMLSDPKKRKAFEKALDINFVDPSQNKNPEHKALSEAASSYSQQLSEKLPTQMTTNVQAQQMLAVKSAQAKATGDIIDKIAPVLLKEEGANNRAYIKADSAQRVAVTQGQFRVQQALVNSRQRADTALKVASANNNTRLAIAIRNNDAAFGRVQAQIKGRLDYLTQHDSDAATVLKITQNNTKLWNGYLKNLQGQQVTNQKAFSSNLIDKTEYQTKQSYLDGQIKETQDQIQAGNFYANGLATSMIQGDNDNVGSAKSTDSSTTVQQSKAGSTNDTDASENDPDYYDPLAKH